MIEISLDPKLFLWRVGMLISRPFDPTNIAKLIPTSAFHFPTALASLYNHFAFHTLPISKVLLKKLHFIFFALSLMHGKHTFDAKHALTSLAFN